MSSNHPSASSENSPPHTPPATAEDFPPDHFIEDPGTDEEHQTLLHRQATILEPSISEQGPASLLPHSTTGHNTLGSPLSDEHEDGESLPEYPEEDFDPGHYDEEDDNYEDMELSAFQSRAVLKSTVEALKYTMEDPSYSPEMHKGLTFEHDACSSQLHDGDVAEVSAPKKQLPAMARKILEGYHARLKRDLLGICSDYDLDERAVGNYVHLGGIPPQAQNHHSLFTTNLARQHALTNQPVLAQDEVERRYHDKRQSIVNKALGEGISVASAMRAWLVEMKKDWEQIELQIKTASMKPESHYREMGKAVEKLGTQVSNTIDFF